MKRPRKQKDGCNTRSVLTNTSSIFLISYSSPLATRGSLTAVTSLCPLCLCGFLSHSFYAQASSKPQRHKDTKSTKKLKNHLCVLCVSVVFISSDAGSIPAAERNFCPSSFAVGLLSGSFANVLTTTASTASGISGLIPLSDIGSRCRYIRASPNNPLKSL